MITCDPLTSFTRFKCCNCGRIWYEPDETGMVLRVTGVLCDECRQDIPKATPQQNKLNAL